MSSSEGMTFETAAKLIANFAKGAPSWTKDDDYYKIEGQNVITPLKEKLSNLSPKRNNESAVLDFLTVLAHQNEDWKQHMKSKEYKEQIDTSIWAKNANGSISGDRWKDPPVQMADVCHVISTAAFCIPEGGAVLSAGASFGSKYLVEYSQRQVNSFEGAVESLFGAKELKRQTNPYDNLETWISQDIDEGFLNQTVEPVKAMANELEQRLNRCIYTKAELDADKKLFDRVTRSMVYNKTSTMIALKSKMSKQSILHGSEGLDIVFKLKEHTSWLAIQGGEASFNGVNISEGLANNPSKAAATYALFVCVSITLQKALQVYAWLTLLPEEAFDNENWDGTIWVMKKSKNNKLKKIKVREDVDVCEALYKSKDNHEVDSAWTILQQLVDAQSSSSSLMKRFDDGRKIWNTFLNRLLDVHFMDGQSPKRNGIWYYAPANGNTKRQYNLDNYNPVTYCCKTNRDKDKFFDNSVSKNMNLDQILKEETKGESQIVVFDKALNNERTLDNVANNFHTHLKLSLWFAPNCPPAPKNPIQWTSWATSVKPVNATERGIIIDHFHKGMNPDYTKSYTFPLVASTDSSNGDAKQSYSDVFWIASKERPSKDTATFMKSGQGRWTIGWLGLVLSNYAQAYGIKFDIEQQTNTFMAAKAALRIHKANRDNVTQLLASVKELYEKS